MGELQGSDDYCHEGANSNSLSPRIWYPTAAKLASLATVDEMHYTAGLRVAFKRLQVDLGVDLSDLVDTGSISAIYSF